MRKGPARAAKAKTPVADQTAVKKPRAKVKKNVVDENCNEKLVAKTKKRAVVEKPVTRSKGRVVDENAGKKSVTKATQTPTKVVQVDTVKKRIPLADRLLAKNKKTPPTVYKNQLIILDDTQMNMSKNELYDFKCDPSKEPAPPKKAKKERKKPIQKSKPAVRRKKLSDSAAEKAMKKMLADLEKVRNANLFKKLKMLKQSQNKKNGNAITAAAPEVHPANLDHHHHSPCPSPMHDDAMDDDNYEPVDSTLNNRSVHFCPPASSSMIDNLHDRPSGSPWRVNLDAENKKWRYNFYVKPSMTPAYERDTFHVMGLDDKIETPSKFSERPAKKSNDANISEKPEAQLKQSSILTFFRESLNKSPKKRAKKPTKPVGSYNFEEITPIKSATPEKVGKTPEKTPIKSTTPEKVDETPEKTVKVPTKSAEKRKTPPMVTNCFGFDEDIDQENVSPVKKKRILNIRQRGLLKPIQRARRVLTDLNNVPKGPMRVTTNQIHNLVLIQNENAEPEKETGKTVNEKSTVPTEVNISSDSDNSIAENANENTSQESTLESVALFEDVCETGEKDPCEMEVEIIRAKPTRKMYQRQKRPPVRFKEIEDYVENDNLEQGESDEFSDYVEKSKPLKKTKKNKPKKANKEFDQWAEGFNSMLEEAEEFTLNVE